MAMEIYKTKIMETETTKETLIKRWIGFFSWWELKSEKSMWSDLVIQAEKNYKNIYMYEDWVRYRLVKKPIYL